MQHHAAETDHLPPAAEAPADVCLFAQYDPCGHIPAHTRHTLAQLAGCGLRLHVACAGVVTLGAEDTAFLAGIGATAHPRPNRGLDFGGWAELLDAGCADGAPRVLLANDSVFGPYGDLRPILARMNAMNLDAWGMVESRERVWHLQSWFLCLTQSALGRPAIRRVFAQDFAAMSKDEIILHGELGLGAALRAERLATGAVWHATGHLRRLIPVNPSHFDWLSMLRSGAVPFLKAELLRENPAGIFWIDEWRHVLSRLPYGDPAALADKCAKSARSVKPARRLLNLLLTRDHLAAARHLL